MRTRYTIALVVIALTVSGCSLMQPRPDDPVMQKLADLDQRLQAVERVVNNQSLVTLSQQVDALQRSVDELRGQNETLTHDSSDNSERQRQFYADLDTRIQALENKQPAAGSVNVLQGGTLPPGQLPVPNGTDRDNYQAAFELLKDQRYEPAVLAFQQFLVKFPDSELADNAQYWLGESWYATAKFDKALTAFALVVANYPRSRKVADALLKEGYCNYELKQWAAARSSLQKVQADFPETTAARLAGQRLERMKSEGV